MPSFAESLPAMVAALEDRYGRAGTSTGGPIGFTRVAAALLRGVESSKRDRLIEALRDAGLLDPSALAEADPAEVAEVARQARVTVGTKTLAGLRRVARWMADEYGGDPGALDAVPTGQLREELLGVNGVGAATADAVLLFGLGRPSYPVDRASYRVFVRHGWIDPTADYDEARDLPGRALPDDPDVLALLSGWLDSIGADFCKPSAPRCERCPLRPFLPPDGPRDPDS
ncbi:MAG TPA: endonuclease III [Isosphaeraceae bacterium]|jgi:endonuclease-3 related protein|nr:endonuclease III [Isosphaeraceae bacterium]